MSIPNSGILQVSPSAYPGSGATLELTPYLDVQVQDGMDPADGAYTEKVWSHSLLKEGGVMALENLQIRELHFPLRLKSTSRDGVANLLISINTAVNLAGQTVGWQDQGSSKATYYDLAGGQFDVQYDFRAAGNFWIKGMLRLFVQPLGHTATMRLAASAAGTGPLLTLPIPSPILGDANALMQAQVSGGSFASALYETVALSVLPYGYVPEYQASQLQRGASTTLVGGSGAVASLFLRQSTFATSASSLLCTLNVLAATPYFGINRLLTIARTNSNGWVGMLQAQYVLGGTQAAIGPTSTIGAGLNGWTPVDLGVVSIPSSLPAATLAVQVWGAITLATNTVAATLVLDVTDVILLPDAQTTFISPAAQMGNDNWIVNFDGINNESYITDTQGVLKFRETVLQRGPVPKLPVGASAQIAALFVPQASSGSFSPPANDYMWASVTVRERTRFSF